MFCSKWCYDDFYMIRDVDKLLKTKQFYSGPNKDMHSYPYLHAKAIYEGFKSEKVSRLIEAILYTRMN